MASAAKIDASKLKQLAEGKTKIIYDIPGTGNVLIQNKDKITAFNAVRANVLEGKAAVSNLTNCRVFEYLNALGLKTHFVRTNGETEFVARNCAMVPIEWVTRRIATGSFLKRNVGVKEGFRFSPPKLEIFYKDDANNDPQWSDEMLIEAKITVGGVQIQKHHIDQMGRMTVAVFEVLERAWAQRGCTLVDMKVEFGVDLQTKELFLADVIDSDSWRLWPAGDRRLQVDKQFYRDLPEVTEAALKELKHKFEWTSEQLKGFFTRPPGRVAIFMGSAVDVEFCSKIATGCKAYGLPVTMHVSSAHKSTADTLQQLSNYEGDGVPTVFVAVAGGSNGLGLVLSGNSPFPVINCPPITPEKWGNEDIWSSLRAPSGLGCVTVLSPNAAATAAATILSLNDHVVWGRLRIEQLNNYLKIVDSDHSEKLATANAAVALTSGQFTFVDTTKPDIGTGPAKAKTEA